MRCKIDKAMRAKSNKSFIREIQVGLIFYFFLLIIILIAIYSNERETLERNSGQALEHYALIGEKSLDQILIDNEQALASILRDNVNIQNLSSDDETVRGIASQKLLNTMLSAAATEDIRYLLVYDRTKNIYLSQYSNSQDVSYTIDRLIKEYVIDLGTSNTVNAAAKWVWANIGDQGYLVRLYMNRKRIIGAVIPDAYCQRMLRISNSQHVLLTDTQNNIIWLAGGSADESQTISLTDVPLDRAFWTKGSNWYVYGVESEKGSFRLYNAMSKSQVLGGWKAQQILIIILILAAILLIAVINEVFVDKLYHPLQDLLEVMGRVENGENEVRLSYPSNSLEFNRINHGFNNMMDTITNLRFKSYEERIQFDEATLKYVQLQIRPHFFLNALTTIHSMSYQNRNEEIREYIERLSKNIRYLFKGGLHTVPLSEEIAHIKDYISMQDMQYTGAVFDFIDIEDRVRNYQIPQLLLHTLVENIYKHAVSVDHLTSILISAREDEHTGEKMCHITVEDDGSGYPSDFLEQMKRGEVKVKPDGHGVGLWNLKMTLSLMYRRDDLITFGNKSPHGSSTEIWIPRRAKRQSSVWKL